MMTSVLWTCIIVILLLNVKTQTDLMIVSVEKVLLETDSIVWTSMNVSVTMEVVIKMHSVSTLTEASGVFVMQDFLEMDIPVKI